MGSIRSRNDNNLLFLDFRFKGVRCRELTALNDSKSNRIKLEKILKKIEDSITDNTFVYKDYFPNSNMVQKFEDLSKAATLKATDIQHPSSMMKSSTPLFKDFYKQWLNEFSLDWRRSYKATVEQIIYTRLLPKFGEYEVGSIRREDILTFRSTLAKDTGRKKDSVISPRRINAIILVLKQILNEAADRFDFTTPTLRIKQLKVPKSDVKPFTLEEVNKIIETVRKDFKQYLIVRFYTGMRTGEIDGLKWKYIDFTRRIIMVRETFTWGMEDYTKTDASQRDIQMSTPVYQALREQYAITGKLSEFVFCNKWYGLNFLDAFQFLKIKLVSFIRRLSAIVSVPTLWIVKHFNVIKDVSFCFLPVFKAFTSNLFLFEIAKKALSNGIIPAVTTTTHTRFYVELF